MPIEMNLKEQFVPLTNELYPGILPHYLISNFGRVYNTYYGCFEDQFLYNGYSRVMLSFFRNKGVVQIKKAVDRLVLNAFAYDSVYDDDEYMIRHKDGDISNNHIDNLLVYTPREHYRYKGRRKKW